LAGLLFDSNGHPMSPTHATKGKKRYRYYISQAVLKYMEGDGGTVLRVPAADVESVVIDQLKELLLDFSVIALTAKQNGIPGCQLGSVMSSATKLADECIGMTTQEMKKLLDKLLVRSVLTQQRIESHFDLGELINIVVPGDEGALVSHHEEQEEHIARTPVALKRCGVENKLVIRTPQKTAAHSDSAKAIRKALKNAHRWNSALLTGQVRTIAELAEKEKCQPRYITDLIKLCFLTPDIQESINTGNSPHHLTLDILKKSVLLSWGKQRSILNRKA
jgi:hypothetical protein